jgi:hypothetical protein
MPHVLRGYGVHRVAGAAALLAVLGVLAELVFERGETMLAFAVAAAAITVVYALWVSLNGVLLVRERTAEWRGAGGELARVRARRPHAGDTDPDAAHDEYAVAVDEGGRLVTFAFMPLAASEDAAPTSVLIPVSRATRLERSRRCRTTRLMPRGQPSSSPTRRRRRRYSSLRRSRARGRSWSRTRRRVS